MVTLLSYFWKGLKITLNFRVGFTLGKLDTSGVRSNKVNIYYLSTKYKSTF